MKKPGLVGPIIMVVIGVIAFPVGLLLAIPGIIMLTHRLSARKLRSGGAPSADPQKQITCKIAGVRHKCRKNNTKPRQEVLQNMRIGNKVLVEEYEYEGLPAYMLIDPATKLDFGVAPANIAKRLAKYEDAKLEARIASMDTFQDEKEDTVYYGEVTFYII